MFWLGCALYYSDDYVSRCNPSICSFQWHEHNNPDVPLVHRNTLPLARALHSFWLERYKKQFPGDVGGVETAEFDEALVQRLDPEMSDPKEIPPYEELKDESLFRKLVATHVKKLHLSGPAGEVITGMSKTYLELYGSA